MQEKQPRHRHLKRSTALAAGLLCTLAATGCGGNTITGNKQPLGTCGTKDYNKPGRDLPNLSGAEILKAANQDVLTLQQRTMVAGGSIDLPRFQVTEITATNSRLELSFWRSNFWQAGATDHVTFPINDGRPSIAIGTVACYSHGELVGNGTFGTLGAYVAETASLQ